MQSAIYKITSEILKNDTYFKESIAKDTGNEYFWSDDWSEEFYILLAQKGFISTSYETKDGLLLLPELQLDYGVLDFHNLHISKKLKKILKRADATLCFNTRFDEVLKQLTLKHKYNWLKDEYALLMQKLHQNKEKYSNFEIISVELLAKDTNDLIAGEIGYIIGKTYTSLSGFSSKEKMYNNYGKVQLILLAKYLEEKEFSFWNLGHPHMEYKKHLGCVTHTREKFLQRWEEATRI